jgi:hypothetical protein
MNVNIYLPDELGERVKNAELEISRICQEALTRRVEEWQSAKAATKGKGRIERIEVKVGDGETPWVVKAFSGRWLAQDVCGEDLDGPKWSVALTKGGKFAVVTSMDRMVRLDVYNSLADAVADGNPECVVEEAVRALGITAVIELDI